MASNTIGNAVAVRTAETINGDPSSVDISHPAPISCTQVPTFEKSEAAQNIR
jgi:hypothetical protein